VFATLDAGDRHHVGAAPTGTGKSLAYLVPAAILATQGSRTLVSTESLGLQHQIVEKDFPAVAAAVRDVTGQDLSVAVHKGWANFVCLHAAEQEAQEALTRAGKAPVNVNLRDATTARATLGLLGELTNDPLLEWALTTPTGDRAEYPHPVTEDQWGKVSVSPDECLKAKCPLLAYCHPNRSRAEAAAAHVVVTNHALLAVQASKAVPVVLGSKTLGDFDSVVVDEAHTLPAVVRGAGSVQVHRLRVMSAARALTGVLDAHTPLVAAMVQHAETLADTLDAVLSAAATDAGGDGAKVEPGADPLGSVGEEVAAWCTQAQRMITTATKDASGAQQLKARKVTSRIARLSADVKQVRDADLGFARWFEQGTTGASGLVPLTKLCLSPVDVSGLLHSQVWTVPVDPDDEDAPGAVPAPQGEGADVVVGGAAEDEVEVPRRPLAVAAVSATMPPSFPGEAGLKASLAAYESPFKDAYAGSMLYVARGEVDGLGVPVRGHGKRQSLDTSRHPEWAVAVMRHLVEAAGGHALVLSATSAAGRLYAQRLRDHARGRWRVLSQWDGLSKQATTREWKADPSAVLVGTRSYMTGVDAPGVTCSLVIVDRVPRAAGNVVDDARVEVVAERLGNEWAARDMVYGVDAAQLLEQAAGRLIRSGSDRGVVAVLDPRLLKRQPFSYSESTRRIYMQALAAFPSASKSTDLATVCAFLQSLTQAGSELRAA